MHIPVKLPSASPSPQATGLARGQLDSLARLGAQMSAIRRDVHMPEKEKKRLLAQLQEQTGAIGQQVAEKSEKQRSARLLEASNDAARASQEAGEQIAAAEPAPAAADGSTSEAQPASGAQAATSPAPAAAQGGSVVAVGSGSDADAGGGQPLGSVVDTYA